MEDREKSMDDGSYTGKVMSRDYESSQRLKGFKFTCVTGNQ
jgi:hypothetical protein